MYYADPVSLGKNYKDGPRVLHFYYKDVHKDKNISVSAFKYNPATGSISSDSTTVQLGAVTDRLIDILNYHTVSFTVRLQGQHRRNQQILQDQAWR